MAVSHRKMGPKSLIRTQILGWIKQTWCKSMVKFWGRFFPLNLCMICVGLVSFIMTTRKNRGNLKTSRFHPSRTSWFDMIWYVFWSLKASLGFRAMERTGRSLVFGGARIPGFASGLCKTYILVLCLGGIESLKIYVLREAYISWHNLGSPL